MSPPPSWQLRLDDPSEPLYTVAVVCDLLDLDAQQLRRLGARIEQEHARPSGNHRRYSRADIEALAAARRLQLEGVSGSALGRILELENRLAEQG